MDGERISCRGFNPMIPNSMIEDNWRIAVMCKFYLKLTYLILVLVVGKGAKPLVNKETNAKSAFAAFQNADKPQCGKA